jgi:NMD protein affecting ribosome stability and mRNA decay
MADAIAQAQWRARKKAGLIQKIHCLECGATLRADSSRAPLCRACWLKTDKGKEYTRKKVAKCRGKST